jgi:hypothetical protein
MRIYVLNLPRATGRRAQIARAAAALGISLGLIEAVDGQTLTDAERGLVDHRRRRRITPYLLSDHEIGCWLSHRRAMQALVASGHRAADSELKRAAFPAYVWRGRNESLASWLGKVRRRQGAAPEAVQPPALRLR